MRTKTLLLTAALSAAGLASSMAQVYSVNAVGYVKSGSVPAGAYAIFGNPLNGTNNNNINAVMPLANDSSNDGCTVLRWNTSSQSFSDGLQWIGGLGWFDPVSGGVSEAQLHPGEGFFFQNGGAASVEVTFVGEVPQGSLSTSITGGNNYSIKSSQVPQAARLGTPGQAGTLEFPAADGDTILIWDIAAQTYKDAYQYVGGFGWFSPVDETAIPDGPLITPALGFFVQRSQAGNVNWSRNFSVNP